MENIEDFIFCVKCGAKNDITANFCTTCGAQLIQSEENNVDQKQTNSKKENKESFFDSATTRLNSWTGGQGAVKVSWREFFGEVLKPHNHDEAEEIFAAGTKTTTPSVQNIANDKVQPWLFSRILLIIIFTGILLSVLTNLNQQLGDLIAVDVVLTIAVPLSALVLFFEINIFKNISFYRVIKIMLIGGCMALILTIILSQFFPISGLNFTGALVTGIIEETAKIMIATYFISKLDIKNIFNGLLIGAAVGTGFAVFENIQYMGLGNQIATAQAAFIRSFLSISDHTEWCAIATAALVIAKGSQRITTSTFTDKRFLRFFVLVILIHTMWDWSIFNNIMYLRYLILAVITWVTVFILIHAALRQLKEIQFSLKSVHPTEVFKPNKR